MHLAFAQHCIWLPDVLLCCNATLRTTKQWSNKSKKVGRVLLSFRWPSRRETIKVEVAIVAVLYRILCKWSRENKLSDKWVHTHTHTLARGCTHTYALANSWKHSSITLYVCVFEVAFELTHACVCISAHVSKHIHSHTHTYVHINSASKHSCNTCRQTLHFHKMHTQDLSKWWMLQWHCNDATRAATNNNSNNTNMQ